MKKNIFLLIILSLTLSACGQTGRLYLPKKSAVLVNNPQNNNIAHAPSNVNGSR